LSAAQSLDLHAKMDVHPFGISPHFGAKSAALAACGGALLGATVIFKTWLTGHVLGISGTARGLLANWRSVDRAAFILGLTAAGPLMKAAYGGFEAMPPLATSDRWPLLLRLLAGGLLIGAGTAFGNGCTSGHGLTGLARLTLRGWVAVPCFMVSAAVAATLSSTADGLPQHSVAVLDWPAGALIAAGGVAALILAGTVALAIRGRLEAEKLVPVLELISGLAFGAGLVVSGMARPSKVAAFLDLRSGAWDPSLAFVMASALLLTFPFFQLLERREPQGPLVGTSWELPPRQKPVDTPLVVGTFLFGIGWGLAGACPGPIWVLLLAVPSLEITMVWLGMIAGMTVWVLQQKQCNKSYEACTLLSPDPEAEAAPSTAGSTP